MNTSKKKFAVIFLILASALLFFDARTQDIDASKNQLRFYVDMAGFLNLNENSKIYQEIYLSIPTYQLSYVRQGSIFIAAVEISIEIKDSSQTILAEKTWQTFSQVDSLRQSEAATILEVAGFLLEENKHSLFIKLKDMESKNEGYAGLPLPVLTDSSKNFLISEIELARSIKKTTELNKFVKNSVEVLPNPSRVFGIESPFLYFYAELYQLPPSTSISKEFYILDSRGDTVKYSQKQFQTNAGTAIWAEKINVLGLVSGRYNLVLNLKNEQSKSINERQIFFWINNPYKTISINQYRTEDIEEFRAQIFYLVKQDELTLFDELNIEGKINYINSYWKNTDAAFRTEHLRKFYLTQERFDSPTMPGWKTDRGRVYIMYGPPDEIEREPAGMDTRAYEIWIYEHLENQAQVKFVFVDPGIQGNYQLVHSTLKSSSRMEIYNPDWMNETKVRR